MFVPLVSFLLASSTWMAAVGIYCQAVHYPTFRLVRPEEFLSFCQMHQAMTGLLVVPAMLVQIAATLALWSLPKEIPAWASLLSLVLLAFSVGWTLTVSGPLHGQIMMAGPGSPLIGKLIESCWVRNAAWLGQALLCLWLLAGPAKSA